MLEKLFHLTKRVLAFGMGMACLGGLIMMLHVAAEVVMRYVVGAPIEGTIEIVSAYYMVIISFFPLAYVAHYEGHIRVELFTQYLSRSRLKKLDIFAELITLVYFSLFTWMTLEAAVEHTRAGEAWQTGVGFIGVWPSRWILPLSGGMFILYLLVSVVQRITTNKH